MVKASLIDTEKVFHDWGDSLQDGAFPQLVAYAQERYGSITCSKMWIFSRFCKGYEDNRGRHTDHLAGCYSIRTNQRSTSVIPTFYAGCPSCCNPPTLSWLGTGTKYAGLHTHNYQQFHDTQANMHQYDGHGRSTCPHNVHNVRSCQQLFLTANMKTHHIGPSSRPMYFGLMTKSRSRVERSHMLYRAANHQLGVVWYPPLFHCTRL